MEEEFMTHTDYDGNIDEDMEYTGYNGNVSEEISYLRDTFLHAERDYLIALLKNEGIRNLFMELTEWRPEKLYEEATKRINRIEYGEVEEKDLEAVEGEITLLLAAIRDKVLLKELVLLPDSNKEKGRSR